MIRTPTGERVSSIITVPPSSTPTKEVCLAAATAQASAVIDCTDGRNSIDEAPLAKSVHSLRSRLYLSERTLRSLAELERLTTGRPAAGRLLSGFHRGQLPLSRCKSEAPVPATEAVNNCNMTARTRCAGTDDRQQQLPPVLTFEELCDPQLQDNRTAARPVAALWRPAVEETDGASQPPAHVIVHAAAGRLVQREGGDVTGDVAGNSHVPVPSGKECCAANGCDKEKALLRETVHALQTEVRAQEKALMSAEEMRERSQKLLAETVGQAELYSDLLSQAEASLRQQKSDIERLEDERDRTLSQLDDLEASLSARQGSVTEVEELRSQLKECSEEKDRLVQSGHRLTQRVTHLEGELRVMETRLACEKKEKNALKQASDSLLGQVNSLVQRVSASRSAVLTSAVAAAAGGNNGLPQSSPTSMPSLSAAAPRAAGADAQSRHHGQQQLQHRSSSTLTATSPRNAEDGHSPLGDVERSASPEVLDRLRCDVLHVLSENVQLRTRIAYLERSSAAVEANLADVEAARQRESSEAKRSYDEARSDIDVARMRCIELGIRCHELERKLAIAESAATTARAAAADAAKATAAAEEARARAAAEAWAGGRAGVTAGTAAANAQADEAAARLLVSDLRRQLNDRDAEIEQLRQVFDDARHVQLHTPAAERSSTVKRPEVGGRDIGVSLTASLATSSTLDDRRGGGAGCARSSLTEAALRDRLHEQDAELCACRKKLATATKQLASSEKQLKDVRAGSQEQGKQLATARAQLEAATTELQQKTAIASTLERQLGEVRAALSERSSALKKLQCLHSDRRRHNAEETKLLEQQCSQYKKLTSDLDSELAATRSILNEKLQLVQQHEQTICLLQQDVKQQQMEADRIVSDLEARMKSAADRVREVETALAACQAELQSCVKKHEAARGLHEHEAAHRSEELEQMEKKLQQVQKLMEVQSTHVCQLQASLEQCQLTLEASESHAHDMEIEQAQLQEQLEQARQELDISRAKRHELECVLETVQAELDASKEQLSAAATSARNSQSRQTGMQSELGMLRQEANKLRKLDAKKDAERRRLRAELDEAVRALDTKSSALTDAEVRLSRAEGELKEQMERNAAFDRKLQEAERAVQQTVEQLQDMQAALRSAQDERDALDAVLHDTRLALRRCQTDLASKSDELDGLRDQLQEQERELLQRAEHVSQLDVAIREHRGDTERRVTWLEGSLRETRAELEKKAARVVQLEAESSRLEAALRSQALELSAAEQHNRRLQQQADQRAVAARDLERQVDALEEQASMLRSAAATRDDGDLAQSDARTQKHEAMLAAMLEQDLLRSQRAREELTAELQQLRDEHQLCAEEKRRLELEVQQMHASAAAATARIEERLRSKLVTDMERTQEELERLQHGHRREIERLEDVHKQLVQSNSEMSADYRSKVKAVEEAERHLRRQLQASIEQVAQLKAELGVRGSMLRAANEAMLVKEAEIARLKAQLGSHDRKAHAPTGPKQPQILATLPLLDDAISLPGSADSSLTDCGSPASPSSVSQQLCIVLGSGEQPSATAAAADDRQRHRQPLVTDVSWSTTLAAAEQLASGLIGRLQQANHTYGELDHLPSGTEDDERSCSVATAATFVSSAGDRLLAPGCRPLAANGNSAEGYLSRRYEGS